MTSPLPEEDAVPVSVKLGAVVPPEDPEDWTRPLTWVAAVGMLAAPVVALAWFWLAAPTASTRPVAGTWLVAAVLVVGAVATGSTQIGPVRAFAGTLGSGLFAALVTIIVGAALAGQRQVGTASPTVAHAFLAATAGLIGALVASILAPAFAGAASRARRGLAPAAAGVAIAALSLQVLFSL
jgi:hypothetical protein